MDCALCLNNAPENDEEETVRGILHIVSEKVLSHTESNPLGIILAVNPMGLPLIQSQFSGFLSFRCKEETQQHKE